MKRTMIASAIALAFGFATPAMANPTNTLNDELGVDVVVMGFGLPDDGTHGPNEHFYLPNYYRGIESYIRFFQKVKG